MGGASPPCGLCVETLSVEARLLEGLISRRAPAGGCAVFKPSFQLELKLKSEFKFKSESNCTFKIKFKVKFELEFDLELKLKLELMFYSDLKIKQYFMKSTYYILLSYASII